MRFKGSEATLHLPPTTRHVKKRSWKCKEIRRTQPKGALAGTFATHFSVYKQIIELDYPPTVGGVKKSDGDRNHWLATIKMNSHAVELLRMLQRFVSVSFADTQNGT